RRVPVSQIQAQRFDVVRLCRLMSMETSEHVVVRADVAVADVVIDGSSPCRIVIRPRAPFVRGDHCVASSEVVELALQCAEAPSSEGAPETGGNRVRWA